MGKFNVKQWTWKSWLMAIFMALVFVPALVVFILGIVTHEEAGFERPETSWDHVPLTVSCSSYTGGVSGCGRVERAIDSINRRLGFDMLVFVEANFSDIDVTLNAPIEVGAEERDASGGHFVLRRDMSSTYFTGCTITTMNVPNNVLHSLVIKHELGHCMGLAHDDFAQSIMFKRQREPEGFHPWITDWDRRLLRDRYRSQPH